MWQKTSSTSQINTSPWALDHRSFYNARQHHNQLDSPRRTYYAARACAGNMATDIQHLTDQHISSGPRPLILLQSKTTPQTMRFTTENTLSGAKQVLTSIGAKSKGAGWKDLGCEGVGGSISAVRTAVFAHWLDSISFEANAMLNTV